MDGKDIRKRFDEIAPKKVVGLWKRRRNFLVKLIDDEVVNILRIHARDGPELYRVLCWLVGDLDGYGVEITEVEVAGGRFPRYCRRRSVVWRLPKDVLDA